MGNYGHNQPNGRRNGEGELNTVDLNSIGQGLQFFGRRWPKKTIWKGQPVDTNGNLDTKDTEK